MYCKKCNLFFKNHKQHILSRKHKNIIQQNEFIPNYKCTYNGIQKAIDKAYKEHVYNKISISDYKEYLEIIKRKNNNIKYQLIILVEFYKNTAGGRKTIEN